jgi:ribosomal-protein-alanine N-acetyltransferase
VTTRAIGSKASGSSDTPRTIVTERLELIPATTDLIRAALEGEHALAQALKVSVPATWPPEYLDSPALEFVRNRLTEEPSQLGWWLYFVVVREAAVDRVLIGSAGYKGPPSTDGTVEVGYGIVRDRHRQGHGSEAVRGLLAHAFAVPAVVRVIAETYPELAGSIGVLRKCGFRLIGDGSEPGVIRFELTRTEYASRVTLASDRRAASPRPTT